MKNLKVEFAKGNKKLPEKVYILNMGSAKDCPSKKLGLCQCSKECYARKAELQYKAVLPYRERQRKVFDHVLAENIAESLLTASKRARKNKMHSFRFSEAGDFNNQKDVEKMMQICRILTKNGVRCYGYTARTDLNLSGLMMFATINVSNDLNDWQNDGANRFKAVSEYTGKNAKCVGDCRKCTLCEFSKGRTVEVKIH